MSTEHFNCQECGMMVGANEYHPFAACLMFQHTKDSRKVRANLTAIREHGENRWRSLAEQLQDALVKITKLRATGNIATEALSAFDSLRKEESND